MKKIIHFIDKHSLIIRLTLIVFVIFTLVVYLFRSILGLDEIPIYESNYFNFSFLLVIIYSFVGNIKYFREEKEGNLKSDEGKLLDKKKEFLDSILQILRLDVDKDLKKHLEAGDIDEANTIIEEKINALNVLVETVKGNNSKSLRGTDISSVSEFYESTNGRIRTEITRQQTNGLTNRFIGIVATLCALSVLSYTLLGKDASKPLVLLDLAPRVTLSILIESFAFFFFYQYRKNQEEIKFWNNEKTDLDMKIFALSLAIDDEEIGTKEFMQGIITDLLKSDRNLILKKDEKETDKGNNLTSNNLIDDFIGKVQKLSSSFIGDKKG